MYAQMKNPKENKNRPLTSPISYKKRNAQQPLQFVDNRVNNIIQRNQIEKQNPNGENKVIQMMKFKKEYVSLLKNLIGQIKKYSGNIDYNKISDFFLSRIVTIDKDFMQEQFEFLTELEIQAENFKWSDEEKIKVFYNYLLQKQYSSPANYKEDKGQNNEQTIKGQKGLLTNEEYEILDAFYNYKEEEL